MDRITFVSLAPLALSAEFTLVVAFASLILSGATVFSEDRAHVRAKL